MSATARMRDARWTIAECHLIAQWAYSQFVDVEPWAVHDDLEVWRAWFYHLVPTSRVLRLGTCRIITPLADWRQ
jgi:hypothetical protein